MSGILGISHQVTSGSGNALSFGVILYDFCPACTSITDPRLGFRRMNGRSESERVSIRRWRGNVDHGGGGGHRQVTLTVHRHGHVLLHELVAAADAALVQAAVRALKAGDGQDVVEQNVRLMFDEPLVGGAGGVILKREQRAKERLSSSACLWHMLQLAEMWELSFSHFL